MTLVRLQLTNFEENLGRCPQLWDQGQTTTPGTAFPALCLNCVSSLTSPAYHCRRWGIQFIMLFREN